MSARPAASPFIGELEPITATDAELRDALADAALQPLLPALAYATGDLTLLRDDLKPDPLMLMTPAGGFTPDQTNAIRDLAFDALRRFRDGGSIAATPPPDDVVLRIMEFAVGAPGLGAYLPLVEEELAYRGEDRRAPSWHLADVAPGTTFEVGVIGAGFSGLLAAHRLRQAGVSVVVFEKNDDVGGTWFENRYPGCRVDNPSHMYSYSFAQRHDWPYHFSPQPVLHEYLRRCAAAFEVRDLIRFETEVTSAAWSDETSRWTVHVRSGEGEEVHRFDAVVSAVGQLNRPSYPTEIPGFGSFGGAEFHSARWDQGIDLTGKRVAVIGTGASALQFVPEIAPTVSELLVFQRTPPWFGLNPLYHEAVADGLRWLYAHVPSYAEWNRFCMFWRLGDGFLASVAVDPDWDGGGTSIGPVNDLVRSVFLENLQTQFEGRPDLLDACTPHYPPGAKRIIQDNGAWPGALKRVNVRLLDGSAISAITPTGIVTAAGVEEPVDVIIYGTGFTASKFLAPMTIIGRDNLDLHEHWAGEPRAYLGVTVPGFPNLFCLYGPNTNIVINGSIVYFSECGVRYFVELLGTALASGYRAVDVRSEVHDRFNVAVDAENRMRAWGASDVSSWYKNDSGRVTQNWPFTLLEYWQRTSAPAIDDYELRAPATSEGLTT